MTAVDISAKGTEILEVTLRELGSYVFSCDKFLHRWPFGMDGTLVVR